MAQQFLFTASEIEREEKVVYSAKCLKKPEIMKVQDIQKLTAAWTIQNVGDNKWPKDIKFEKYNKNLSIEYKVWQMDLDLAPGQQVNVLVDVISPKDNGTYNIDFALVHKDEVIIKVDLQIQVQKIMMISSQNAKMQ